MGMQVGDVLTPRREHARAVFSVLCAACCMHSMFYMDVLHFMPYHCHSVIVMGQTR